MSNRVELLTPVGRLVQGSLYEGSKTDAENRPLVYKSGPNQGQPRIDFFFALAIKKGTETHWSQTDWGKKIWDVGHKGFPNGQASSPTFAWKITDGDSNIPNKVGKKPCDREGFSGHWILNFSSGFAPGIYNADGSKQILEPNAINLGDYIQVFGSVADNEALQQPGVYLNHTMVALAGYGDRIISSGADPKNVGFGNSPLPAGASATPLAQSFNPTTPPPLIPPATSSANHSLPVSPPAPVTPHTAILSPPPPAAPIAPVRQMTALANGIPYEQYISIGWSDALLIQHGYMLA